MRRYYADISPLITLRCFHIIATLPFSMLRCRLLMLDAIIIDAAMLLMLIMLIDADDAYYAAYAADAR